MGDPLKVRASQLRWRPVDGEVIVLDLRTEVYLSLNRSGARLWPLLVAGSNRRDLVDELVTVYGIDASLAGDDVDRLLAQLTDADMLEEPDPAEARLRT